jgi:hypothetical protein
MASFLTDRLLSPRTGPAVAAFLRTPQRRPIDRLSMVKTVLHAIGDWLLLLWMLAVIVLFALIGAGAARLLR